MLLLSAYFLSPSWAKLLQGGRSADCMRTGRLGRNRPSDITTLRMAGFKLRPCIYRATRGFVRVFVLDHHSLRGFHSTCSSSPSSFRYPHYLLHDAFFHSPRFCCCYGPRCIGPHYCNSVRFIRLATREAIVLTSCIVPRSSSAVCAALVPTVFLLIDCSEPVQLTWAEGTGPFYLSVYPGKQTSVGIPHRLTTFHCRRPD